jgi:acetyl-CoA carboxylase biotin carboxyl carrier protein
MTEPTGQPQTSVPPGPAAPSGAPDGAPLVVPAEPVEPVAVAPDPALLARLGDGDASLLALIDRLAVLLARSDLAEIEVEAGGTGLVLRKPSALAPAAGAPAAPTAATEPAEPHGPPERPSVKAPLTGIFYSSPAPGSAPFVTVGSEVGVGTVIGLIEAMKLFNEIKSDLAGRVVRVVAETGSLVKAKQPLIEVEPL